MNRKPFALRTKLASLATVGAVVGGALIAGPVIAQTVGELTVTAPRVVHQQVGRSSITGAPIELISLSRQVNFGDLDLTTDSGAQTLNGRVMDTAKQACAELENLYPLDPPNVDCFKAASAQGVAQANMVVAAARKR